MRTKSMSRLLRKNDNSPSGWEIAGYELKICSDSECSTYQGTTDKPAPDKRIGELLDNWTDIEHDAFELGIEMEDGTWVFEGDKFISKDEDLKTYTLVWRNSIPEFQSEGNDSMIALRSRIADMERTGSIHDKPDN